MNSSSSRVRTIVPGFACSFKGFRGRRTRRLTSRYFADDDAPEVLRPGLASWRAAATFQSYPGPIVWTSRQGYTLKEYGPKAGPCYENWRYLQDRRLQNDEPTMDACGFWIPKLLPESTRKNVKEQLALLRDFRKRFRLPKRHLSSFGSAALLSALILAHHKRTGEKTPQDKLWTRTDTLCAGGRRLGLGGFGEHGLSCGLWRGDDSGFVSLGCLPLGVETLGQ